MCSKGCIVHNWMLHENLKATSNNLRKWINGIFVTILRWCNALMMLQVLFFFHAMRLFVLHSMVQKITYTNLTQLFEFSLSLSLSPSLHEGSSINFALLVPLLFVIKCYLVYSGTGAVNWYDSHLSGLFKSII